MNWIAILLVTSLALPQTAPPRAETREALARQFATETDKSKKMLLAVQLRLLGDTNPAYFDYLEPFAREALENAGPDPYPFGVEWPSGKPPELTREYLRWRDARGIDPNLDPVQRLREHLNDFLLLVACRDPKARPLLLQALRSENGSLEGIAIAALLNLGNYDDLGKTDDIDTIVQALRSRPLPARRAHYLALEHQPQFLTPDGTARLVAALSRYDPEGLAIFRERRRHNDKLRAAEKAAEKAPQK